MKTGVILLTLSLVMFLTSCQKKQQVSLEAVSPDGRFKVQMIELPGFDRNFQLRLISDGKLDEIIYSSPDEGRPVGTERILWAKDSDSFLLVGRHFTVGKEYDLPNGEQLYLLYQISTRKLKGNALQANHPKFSKADLEGIALVTPLP